MFIVLQITEHLAKGKAKSESYLTSLVTHAIVVDPTCYEAEKAQELWQIPTVTVSFRKFVVLYLYFIVLLLFVALLNS